MLFPDADGDRLVVMLDDVRRNSALGGVVANGAGDAGDPTLRDFLAKQESDAEQLDACTRPGLRR